MMIKKMTVLIWLCLTTLSLAEWKPVDFKKWKASDNDTTFKAMIGGTIANYPDTDTSWATIENDFEIIGDTITARHCFLKTDVLPNGVSRITVQYEGNTYTVTQIPRRLIWLKTDTWNWVDVIPSGSWGTPSVDSNIVKWTNVFPGVDYRIRQQNGRVEHGVFFKKAFLDSAVTLYNQRPDSLDIALGNVIEYTFSSNIDSADVGIGNIDQRILKKIGKYLFKLDGNSVGFPGSDTLTRSLGQFGVHDRWVKVSGKIYCVEYIPMRTIKVIHETYPNATIWHNASPTTIDGTTNVEDAFVYGTAPDNNYGGYVLTVLTAGSRRGFIRCKNLSSLLEAGITITSCILHLYCTTNSTDGVVTAYRLLKPWVEGDESGTNNDDGDVTYADWASDANEWATEGGLCPGTDCDDNSVDDGICTGACSNVDRNSVLEDTVIVTTASTWYDLDITTALAQSWYDGTNVENGLFLTHIYTGSNQFRSTEGATEQPYWVITYTGGGAARSRVIIIK